MLPVPPVMILEMAGLLFWVKRMIQSIKGTRSLIDATQGRKTKAVIVTSDDYIVLSALQPETIARRFAEAYDYEEREEEHE